MPKNQHYGAVDTRPGWGPGKGGARTRRAFRSEQRRPWFRHNPTGADAVAATTKAACTARERVAEYLLAARLEQRHERSAARPERPASWTERLPGLAARPLDGDASGVVTE
ncbi:hypothetical protein ACFYWU_34190 [Streptomyces chrestomyceticus]|uniref:hypothetical protein n=1 Tax=Streptomyces chrestomyceticus TaxID=68185 RepID=UPI00369722F7